MCASTWVIEVRKFTSTENVLLFHFLKSIVLLLYYIIRAKGLQPVLCVFCTAKETGSSELFSLFLFAYPPHQPKWPNGLPLTGSWFPASATSSYIFLTINLNSYQNSHSWHSGNTYMFCGASPDHCIWKCLLLSVSFYCCISRDPVRKTIHYSYFTRENLIKNLFKQVWEGKWRGEPWVYKETVIVGEDITLRAGRT